jgi:3-phosphoshikimate 1-carboxyvinyltransferase
MVERPLAELGATVVSNKGYLPIDIRGPLKGGEVTADGSVSSQFITGLLMALPVTGEDSRIYVENLVSKPYIDLTLSILHEFGIEIMNDNYSIFSMKGGQKYVPGIFTAEGDWSGGAFLLVMGAIGGEVEITGLKKESTQADKAVVNALKRAGAEVRLNENNIIVGRRELKGFEFDVSECPDLAPPLTVLAMACKGRSVINGTERLAAKESDRGKALEQTLNSIGGFVTNFGDRIEVEGGRKLKGGLAHSHNDHRIAMALSVSALLSGSEVVVEGMECINKSYPGFIDDFNSLGGNIVQEK